MHLDEPVCTAVRGMPPHLLSFCTHNPSHGRCSKGSTYASSQVQFSSCSLIHLHCSCARRQLDELVRTSEERMAKLRAELLLREENYNKHFKNGGAGEKVKWRV